MIGFLFRWVLLFITVFVIAHSVNAWFVDTLGGELLGIAVISLGAAAVRSVLKKIHYWNRRGLVVSSAVVVLTLGAGVIKLLPNWEVNNAVGIGCSYVLGVLATTGVNTWIEDR